MSAARRAESGRASTVAAVIVVLVLGGAVAVGFVVADHRRSAAAAEPIPSVTSSAAAVPVRLDGVAGVVEVGQPTAARTVDVYEDPLCPICGQFEREYGEPMRAALAAGHLRVRYHVLNLLDDRSSPPGYSLRAAAASLAVATARPEVFMSFHDSLFGHQPEEGSAGYTAAQLDRLAVDLGVPAGTVTGALDGKTFDAAVQRDLDTAMNDPALRQHGGFGTPTIAEGGTRVDPTASTWLSDPVTRH